MNNQNIPNLDTNPNGFDIETEGNNLTNPDGTAKSEQVDYKVKFSESTRGAQKLLDEKKEWLAREAEYKAKLEALESNNHSDEPLYPGFEQLSDAEQENIRRYGNSIVDQAYSRMKNDPTYAEASARVNEEKWNAGFEVVATAFPELHNYKAEFKAKYFQKNNVPDNIDTILGDLAKAFLYDQAQDIGIKKGEEIAKRIDPLRTDGGSGGEGLNMGTHKTLAEWQHLASTNAPKFASMEKLFNEDMASGKL